MTFSKAWLVGLTLIAAASASVAAAEQGSAAKKPDRAPTAFPAPQNAAVRGRREAVGVRATSAKPQIVQFALQNGLHILVIPDHRAPVVTHMLWYRVGAVDDPPGISGLAHFFEHMMFRGTKAVPGDGFSTTVARNGGEDNAFTTHDDTAFYVQIAKDRLRAVMGLEADRMAGLDLSAKAVHTERDVVMEERRMRIDNNPQALLEEQMAAALHLSHPYAKPVIGWMAEIRHIGRSEAQSFFDRHYGPNNAILVVAGDVTPEEVRNDAQAAYGKVPAREIAPHAEFAEPPRLGPARLTLRRADAKLPLLLRYYRVLSYPQAQPGQAESLEVLAQLMGGDSNSALYRELVVKQKLASDAGADYEGLQRDAGTFSVYAVPRPGVSLERLEAALDRAIAQLRTQAAAPSDLARAKTQLIARAIYRRDGQFAQASAYGEALAIGLTVQDVSSWPERIERVDAGGVEKAAASQLLPEQSVTGSLIPEGGAK